MTNWTEAQIDRHLRLWTEKLGPDSPEASIVRQLRDQRDAARGVSKPAPERPLTLRDFGYAPGGYVFTCQDCGPLPFELSPIAAKYSSRCEKHAQAALSAALTTTQETPNE